MNPTARLVVFDVDGTLVDSQDHIVSAMAEAFAQAGCTAPSRPEVLDIVGLSLPEAIGRLTQDQAAPVQAQIMAAYKQIFSANSPTRIAPLYPGARDFLDDLRVRPGMLLGVATGNSRRGLARILDNHGLTGVFATSQVADDHPSKPDPSMLLAAMDETGVTADQAVMIGDTSYDMAMGRAAGMQAIGVVWGYHPAEMLRQAGATEIVGSFAALRRVLGDRWGPG
ncbi:MAG: HAD-IA family hydrolase [Rhodobacteraceae bacterium]|nr:HAD-IA family hydrolase [Paracoccaceae bacterium]MCP5342028.1 HAD-IA family hydrolase [Paracoccaceae bacterium]